MFGNWRTPESKTPSLSHGEDSYQIQKSIDEDRKLYPHCGYSTQQSTSCSSSAESGYVCETINRIQRLCPNEKPVTILSSKNIAKNPNRYLDSESNDKDFDASFLPNLFSGKSSMFGGLFSSAPEDPFKRLEDVEKDLRGIVAGHKSGRSIKFPSVSPSLGRDAEKDSSIWSKHSNSNDNDDDDKNRMFSWSRGKSTTSFPETQYDPKSVERV